MFMFSLFHSSDHTLAGYFPPPATFRSLGRSMSRWLSPCKSDRVDHILSILHGCLMGRNVEFAVDLLPGIFRGQDDGFMCTRGINDPSHMPNVDPTYGENVDTCYCTWNRNWKQTMHFFDGNPGCTSPGRHCI
ncbi:hypothetical protein H2248_003823 [Termitomyces sp. 'cryptogamus']|nr:hypothetical protein H2248_003823 [Termitomyces sp. 'cryptogamus']